MLVAPFPRTAEPPRENSSWCRLLRRTDESLNAVAAEDEERLTPSYPPRPRLCTEAEMDELGEEVAAAADDWCVRRRGELD